MARGAAQAQQRKRAQAAQPKRKQKAPSWEDELFFSRLRRHTKPVYVLLALVFAAGFVVLGVGSGSTGIGDILSQLFHGGSSGSSISSQIKDDQKKITANPRNIALYTDLATLYQQKQDQAAATATLESALTVQPKNIDVLTRLASIYQGQADSARTVAANAQNALAAENATPPGLNVSSTLGQAFTSDPLSQTLKTNATAAFQKLGTAYGKAESGYERLAAAAKGTSQEANAQLQLASIAKDTVQVTGQQKDALIAIAAYKRYLKLQPNGVQASLAKQTLQQLQAFVAPQKH